MGERALRDHLNELVMMGLIQRRMRYDYRGKRTSDWYRVPIRSNHQIVGQFPKPESHETPAEWGPTGLPADSAGSGENRLPAESAGSPPESDETEQKGTTTGRSEPDYRQSAAGKRKDFRKNLSSSSVVRKPQAARADEEEDRPKEPPKPKPDPLSDQTLLLSQYTDDTTGIPDLDPDDTVDPDHADDHTETTAHTANRVVSVAEALNWTGWGSPTPEQLLKLYGPIERALQLGWQPDDLIAYCDEAIQRAERRPGLYLLEALKPHSEGGWLKAPPRRPSPHTDTPHTMSRYEWRKNQPDPVDDDTREQIAANIRRELESHRVAIARLREGNRAPILAGPVTPEGS